MVRLWRCNLTDIQEFITTVETSDLFTEREYDYLVHVFCHVRGDDAPVELGYYHKKEDTITVFTVNPVEKRPPEKVFKEAGVLGKLAVSDVTVGLSDVRQKAREYAAEKYPTHPVQQEICILQQAEIPMWNLTLVTSTLNMLSLKINAVTGEIFSEDMHNIMSLRANTGQE